MTTPSPAELLWRIRWLAGTAVPQTAGATWAPPRPEPTPEQVTAWLQAPALAEIEPVPRGRSRFRESIRVELQREAQRVYVAAQQEVDGSVAS